jgi:ribose transport system ATP-binding protein
LAREARARGLSTVRADRPANPVLEVRDLVKTFPGVKALAGVSLEIWPGEIRGLVGQNGSGKSTLIKILAGVYAPEAGEMWVSGERVHLPLQQSQAQRLGLSFLHQEPSLARGMTVTENIRLQQFETSTGWKVRWRRERARVAKMLTEFGLTPDPDRPLSTLPQAEQALVGFLRAYDRLNTAQGVFVLDEPTAYLPAPAVERLFSAVRRVASTGTAVLFVSHRVEEVLSISHRVSVLRDGHLVGTASTAEVTESELVALMLGRELGRMYPARAQRAAPGTEAVIEAQEISGKLAHHVSLQLRPGEIVGLTGLVGMGHDEVPYLLFGAEPLRGGQVFIGGQPVRSPQPALMRSLGVCLLPADRMSLGGVQLASVRENVSLPVVGQFFSGGLLRRGRERVAVLQLLESFDVRPRETELKLGSLSGGNQQKALLAKWLQLRPKALLLHEPTQGVDIGARRQIFSLLRAVADAGTAVLIASAEYEDLANLCSSVGVMRGGTLVGWLEGNDLTEANLTELCLRPAKSTSLGTRLEPLAAQMRGRS